MTTTRKFQPGDKIRCVSIDPCKNGDKIAIGEIYTVAHRTVASAALSTEVILDEIESQFGRDGWFFDDCNFELVDADAVVDIDVNGAYDRAMRGL